MMFHALWMDQLVFDERAAAQLEAFYRSSDVRRRRALVLDALGAAPGDEVLDLGCGPGFYVADVLDRVGASGAVTGVDPSAAMLAMTRRRVEGRSNVAVLEGDALRVPAADASFDRAVSVQVFEYVADVEAALTELARVLRPGGRAVIWDIDWSTLSWHAQDADRMDRMTTMWDRHLADPTLPRTLAAALRRAGFVDVDRRGHVFETRAMDPETFGGALPLIIGQYAEGLADVDQQEVAAWIEELRALDAGGDYSFAVVQFCFTASRGGS